jgi:hypothetical protein
MTTANPIRKGNIVRAKLSKQPRPYRVLEVAKNVATIALVWREPGKEGLVEGVAREVKVSDLKGAQTAEDYLETAQA